MTKVIKQYIVHVRKDSLLTLQRTPSVFLRKSKRRYLYQETVTVYCENHMDHINTLCGQEDVKPDGTCTDD